MPSTFAITPDTNSLKLDKQGRGEFNFTVTNTSGQPITGRARVTPQNPQQQSWFRIQGEPERRYPAEKGTEPIKVQIAAPPTATPGSYSFHLDVISVDNPDELYTIGPATSFEVRQADVKPPMKVWPIVAIVVAALVIGVGLYFLLSKKKVPNIVGKTQADAETALKTANLKLGAVTWQRTGTHVSNTVISQTPAAGAAIPTNETIAVALEQDPFAKVPSVVGLDIKSAQDALAKVNLTQGQVTNQQDAPGNPNTVLSQDPRANLQVSPGTQVNLVVKADTVRVPPLVGKPFPQALSDLTATQLLGNPIQVLNPGVPVGTVFNQIPPASTIVARQTTVILYVALAQLSQFGLATQVPQKQLYTLPLATRNNITANHVAVK